MNWIGSVLFLQVKLLDLLLLRTLIYTDGLLVSAPLTFPLSDPEETPPINNYGFPRSLDHLKLHLDHLHLKIISESVTQAPISLGI